MALQLARARAARISRVRYELDLALDERAQLVEGTVRIHFDWRAATRSQRACVLDYRPIPGGKIRRLRVNGTTVRARRPVSEHLVLGATLLTPGANTVEASLEAPIHAAGAGLTRFCDPVDGACYVYSLLVPADASTVFPCFDQPDLKARFRLSLTLPARWTAIGNAAIESDQRMGTKRVLRFAASEPISTYLFAFTAGPFTARASADPDDATRLWVRRSQRNRAARSAAEVLRLNRAAVRYFEAYLRRPFPFAKYDLVAIPDFPYNGMEHAGATFLHEDAILLARDAGPVQRLRRAHLIFHETAHQWLGNLVTMRWFDDLWLKEGFANFLADRAARAIVPQLPVRTAFHALKASAARADATRGAAPLRQALANLAQAKSVYGPVVYARAPALLRQTEHAIGASVFRRAVRTFVRAHAWGSADWRDLVGALERASGRDLTSWARAWITGAGQPIVRQRVRAHGPQGRVDIALDQRAQEGRARSWPQRLEVLLRWQDGSERVVPVELRGRRTVARVPSDRGLPALAFANHADLGVGVFLLDEVSRGHALARLGDVRDDLLRAQLWESLWQSVRRAELDPGHYVDAVLRHLPGEADEVVTTSVLANLHTALHAYLAPSRQDAIQPRLEAVLLAGPSQRGERGLHEAWRRSFIALARSSQACAALARIADGEERHGAAQADTRFRAACALVALASPGARERVRRLVEARAGCDAARLAFIARAALPDIASKRAFLTACLQDAALPERWIEAGLEVLNDSRHARLTLPLLARALRALPALKRRRKIFFVDRWLAAFLANRHEPDALRIVAAQLRNCSLQPDLRRKLFEASDGITRAITSRRAFPG